MEVASEQDYELHRRGTTVRKEIFELVRQHLRTLTFPETDGDCSATSFFSMIQVTYHPFSCMHNSVSQPSHPNCSL